MKTKTDPPGEGWFAVDGIQSGVRTVERQTKGLEVLQARAKGKTVLDLGCAEGLIANWFVQAGAHVADGIDYSTSRIMLGGGIVSNRVLLHTADLNDLSTMPGLWRSYDIVLLLAILQKLEHPAVLLDFAIKRCRGCLAIRAPAAVLDDARSGNVPLDIKAHVERAGFETIQESDGFPDDPRHIDPDGDAWLGVFQKCT